MAYTRVASDNFEVDHTLDPAYWAWLFAGPYVVLGGHMSQDPNDEETVGMGRFVLGGSHLAQRTTVKFTKLDANAYLFVHVRSHDVEFFSGSGDESIWAEVYPDYLAISSAAGTYVEADEPAVLTLNKTYWARATIDATRNVSAEIFDADPYEGAQAIHFVSSDLPNEDEETHPGFTTIPGAGALRASPGILLDEIIYEVPEVHHMDDKNVAHEGQVAKAVDAQARRTSDHAAIPDLTPTASGTYVQAEATATRAKVNEILDVLRDAELIPPA